MNSYSLTELSQRQEEVLKSAISEPVVVTHQSLPSHILMSFETYQKLIERLTELEDLVWGEKAEENINNSFFVGEQRFTTELQRLINNG
jgi:PHD/YefM family antitoxin component YafN of YafNO toxin-antitoxin module